jgi:hypothetical protein
MNPVADDAAQPGTKFLRFAQKPEMFPGGNEGFLGHVLALAEVADPAVSQRANQDLISPDNLAEGIAVTTQGARDQFRVAVFLCRHCFVVHHTAQDVPREAKEVTRNFRLVSKFCASQSRFTKLHQISPLHEWPDTLETPAAGMNFAGLQAIHGQQVEVPQGPRGQTGCGDG